MKKIKVLIVEDSLMFRQILVRNLITDPMLEVVAQASDPYEARDAIFIFVTSSPLINSAICSAVIPDGLLTNSTAPADIASNTLSLNALITTVGSGYCGN